MTLHHSKHHQTYITNLNKALATKVSLTSTTDIPTRIANQQAIKFNGGGHINHSLFWENLTPASSQAANTNQAPNLTKALDAEFGGLDNFKEKYGALLLGIQGSGWGWLVKKADGSLALSSTIGAGCPLTAGDTPLLTCDVWEHAYYIDYRNVRPKYVEAFWNLVNWDFVAKNFAA